MFSSVFKTICTLICSLHFLLSPYAHAEDHANCNLSSWLKPGLLNSTRIELKFGSYGVQILAQDQVSGIRLSSLYSEHGTEKIARTIAFTQYEANLDDRLKMAHQKILEGGSIGSTLKKYGFDIKKDILFKGLVEGIPDQLQCLMHTQKHTFATVIYNLSAKEGNNDYPYCTIAEIYSPEFLTLVEVDQIYPESLPENDFDAIDIINHIKHVKPNTNHQSLLFEKLCKSSYPITWMINSVAF